MSFHPKPLIKSFHISQFLTQKNHTRNGLTLRFMNRGYFREMINDVKNKFGDTSQNTRLIIKTTM